MGAYQIVVLRHGSDTGVGERPLKPGEGAELVKKISPQMRSIFNTKADIVYSSPALRARETAAALSDREPVILPALGVYPEFSPEVMAYAKANGVDGTAAFFAVEGADRALALCKEHGGAALADFIFDLRYHHSEHRVLIVTHGGAIEYLANAYGKQFPATATFGKGEGLWIDADDPQGISLGGLIRR